MAPDPRLQEIPGIGQILGLTIALETGDAKRFADAGNFASYCRCVKSLRPSNGKKKGENNRKMRQQVSGLGVRGSRATSPAATMPQCRRFYDRKKQQTNPVIATQVAGLQTGQGRVARDEGRCALRRHARLPGRPRKLISGRPVVNQQGSGPPSQEN